jgi:phage terminase large subunit-like protein
LKWIFARPDWETRIRNSRSLIPDLPLNQKEVRRAVGIYNKLRIPDVAGTPSFGEAGADWFREIIAAIFGSYDNETGVRHVRENFNLVPKKNSKTTNGAALMMTALLMNRRPRAEFLLTGPTHDVSELAFNQAAGMIECDPDGFLQKRMHVQQHLKIITDRRTKARLKVKTFDASVATGPKPAGVLVDELHQIGKIANANKIIGQLRGGMVSQREGFLIFITTNPAHRFETHSLCATKLSRS